MFAPSDQGDQNEQERLRRHQLLRLGLIIMMMFLLFDGESGKSNRSHSNNMVRSTPSSPHDEIIVPENHISDIKSILNLQQNHPRQLSQKPFNLTGMFRGPWRPNNRSSK